MSVVSAEQVGPVTSDAAGWEAEQRDLHAADECGGAALDEEVAQEAHALPPRGLRRHRAGLLC